MKKILFIHVPRILILIGWITILAEYIATMMDTTLGQDYFNSGIIMFTLGATPVLIHVLNKMGKELFEK